MMLLPGKLVVAAALILLKEKFNLRIYMSSQFCSQKKDFMGVASYMACICSIVLVKVKVNAVTTLMIDQCTIS